MAGLNIVTNTADRGLYYINQILDRNQKIVWLVVSMALAIFILGISLLLIGITARDWRILTSSGIITAFLYWPINKILKIRMENIVLLSIALVPIEFLPPEKAAEQLLKIIDRILEYDQKAIGKQ